MRTIPAAMRTKLLNRFKASATESEPSVRVIATQASTNILLTEPIHEDILPDYGDVTLRQMEGEASISLAYAVCLDEGIATVWRRKFPATMDYEWEFMWEIGEADDVAIEYDGEWTMDGSREWYYLKTEQFPYIFTLVNGNLYVQKWRDAENRILLAEGVSNISACKGWFDYTNQDNDQGLIIGYIRDGGVYYRTYAYQTLAETKVWEIEQKVTVLENNNSILSVIRTNDFRIGFLTEQSGQIKLAITKRTYPGASVKPEYLHVSTDASLWYEAIRYRYSVLNEYAAVRSSKAFFMLDNDDHRMTVLGAERIYTDVEGDRSYLSGVKVFLDRPLLTDLTALFVSRCTVSSNKLIVAGVEFDDEDNALVYSFDWAPGVTRNIHPNPFDVTFPTCYEVTYDALDGQVWYIEGHTVSLESAYLLIEGNDNEYLAVSTPRATFAYTAVTHNYAYNEEHASVSTTATMIYIPVGDVPL